MKKIYLNEAQFKQFVKIQLNEGLLNKIKGNIAAKQKSGDDLYKEKISLLSDWKEWANSDPDDADVKLSEADLMLGDDTTPLTFSEMLEKQGYDPRRAMMAIKTWDDNLFRKTHNGYSRKEWATIQKDPSKAKDINIGGREDINNFKRRHIAGEEARKQFDRKIENNEKDALFKKTLEDVANNNVPDEETGQTKLPVSGNDPQELAQDKEFLIFKEYCKENRIICTDSGDVYIPVKSKLTAKQENTMSIGDFIQNGLSDNLEWSRLVDLIRKFMPRGWISTPHKEFAGFGGDNMSRIIWIEYLPQALRKR